MAAGGLGDGARAGPGPRLAATDTGQGQAVLLVHGQPGQRADWDALVARLQPTHRVIVPDRPGWGDTGGPAAGLRANGDSLAGLLEGRGLASATVVGHSLGGGVALAMALAHPRAVRALVLVASVGTRASLGTLDRVLGLSLVGPTLTRAGLATLARLSALFQEQATRLPPELVSVIQARGAGHLAMGTGPGWMGTAWASFSVEQRALLDETPALEAALATLDLPVAVVAGRRDRVVPPKAARALASAIPGAELIWVEGAGHLLHWDAADRLAEVVRRYASPEDFGTEGA